MNNKILLLLVGLFVGGVVGWFTKPAALAFQFGDINIEISADGPVDSGQGLTSEQVRHIGLIGAIGGLIGLGLGIAVDRKRA